MTPKPQPLDTLEDIKKMMERSSRFISLSGLSGVAAGCCALIGAWITSDKIECWKNGDCRSERLIVEGDINLRSTLLQIGVLTFVAAFILALFFTYLRSKRTNTPLWGITARRLMWNVAIPMVVGGFFVWKMLQSQLYGLIAPACLLFYGLALVNASKYTLKEVRYLGLGEIILGLINLWFIGWGLYFWTLGFGVLHIVYGIVMWWKYEKNRAGA